MNPMNRLPLSAVRAGSLALLAVALLAGSGCSWWRGKSGYEQAPEARPLEIPPELDRPPIDPAMNIPDVKPVAATAPRSAVAVAASSAPFVLADAADSAWRRVGLALDRIDGVAVTDRAQLLNAYGVTFDGESFLIRVSADGTGSRISATSADGRESTTAAATRLLGLLKARLG